LYVRSKGGNFQVALAKAVALLVIHSLPDNLNVVGWKREKIFTAAPFGNLSVLATFPQ